MKHDHKFYSNCLSYLEEWTVQFNDIEHFHWVTLKKKLFGTIYKNHSITVVNTFQIITFLKMTFLMKCHFKKNKHIVKEKINL